MIQFFSTREHDENDSQQLALIAGFTLFFATICFFLFDQLICKYLFVSNGQEETLNHISGGRGPVLIGLVSLVMLIVSDIVIASSFYHYFKKVDYGLSVIASWLRYLSGIFRFFFAIAFAFLLALNFKSTPVQSDFAHLQMTGLGELSSDLGFVVFTVLQFLWAFAFLLLGAHLILTGYLISKARRIPAILGYVSIIAGGIYILDTIRKYAFPEFSTGFGIIVGYGEIALALWLLLKTPVLKAEQSFG